MVLKSFPGYEMVLQIASFLLDISNVSPGDIAAKVKQNTDTIQSPQFFSHSSILPLPLSKTGSFVVSAYRELFAFKAFLEDC